MQFRQSPDFLLISQAAAAVFAAARLLHFHLWRRFPFLCSYLLVTASISLILSVLLESSRAYFRIFLAAEPIYWCAAAIAVFEMFALIFGDYPGLRTAGRWALCVALAVSAATSLWFAEAFRGGGSPNSRWLLYELVFDRSIHFSLAVIIVILMLFLSRYPLHLGRNTMVASGFFSAMFLAQAVVRLIDSVSPHLFAGYADYSEVGFTSLCFLGWGFMLQAADAPAPTRVPVNKPREAELLQQLESLNQILSRSARR